MANRTGYPLQGLLRGSSCSTCARAVLIESLNVRQMVRMTSLWVRRLHQPGTDTGKNGLANSRVGEDGCNATPTRGIPRCSETESATYIGSPAARIASQPLATSRSDRIQSAVQDFATDESASVIAE